MKEIIKKICSIANECDQRFEKTAEELDRISADLLSVMYNHSSWLKFASKQKLDKIYAERCLDNLIRLAILSSKKEEISPKIYKVAEKLASHLKEQQGFWDRARGFGRAISRGLGDIYEQAVHRIETFKNNITQGNIDLIQARQQLAELRSWLSSEAARTRDNGFAQLAQNFIGQTNSWDQQDVNQLVILLENALTNMKTQQYGIQQRQQQQMQQGQFTQVPVDQLIQYIRTSPAFTDEQKNQATQSYATFHKHLVELMSQQPQGEQQQPQQ